jgi:Zn ribbon nucleic-acid-binding protein
MKVKVTCVKCGHAAEKDLEHPEESARYTEAFNFLYQQTRQHIHPDASDSLQWRIGWEK